MKLIISLLLPLIAATHAIGMPYEVKEATPLRVMLTETLKSGDAKENSTVRYSVVGDVKSADGTVLIPNGSLAFGKVIESKRNGAFGKRGRLNFTCDRVLAANGTEIPLRAESKSKGKSDTASQLGMAIFTIGGALFIRGHNVTIKSGTILDAFVDRTTPLPFSQGAISPVSNSNNQVAAPTHQSDYGQGIGSSHGLASGKLSYMMGGIGGDDEADLLSYGKGVWKLRCHRLGAIDMKKDELRTFESTKSSISLIVATDGWEIRGSISKLDAGKLTVQTDAGEKSVDMATVSSIT